MCLGTECVGHVDEQRLHAQKEMELGVSGALLNSAIPANPVSWLFLSSIGMSSATVWQGWGLRNKCTTQYRFPTQTHFLLPPAALGPQAGRSVLHYGLLCSLASG